MEDELLVEPPNYYTDDPKEHIFDICFHPKKDYISYGNIYGEAKILKYSPEDISVVFQKKLFEESCRCVLFDPTGNRLATGGHNGALTLLDQNGKVLGTLSEAHKNPVYSLLFLNENILASGRLEVKAKLWDLRTSECVYEVYEQKEGTISQMVSHSSLHYLLATSTSGHLGVYDLRKNNTSKEKLYALSDQMEEEYLCLALVKDEQKVAVGTSSGTISMFNWDWFGDCKDRLLGHPEGVECMLKYSENVLITGCEDGWIRIVGIYPHSVNLFHQHEDDAEECFPISEMDMSHDCRILASISHDATISFFDLTEASEQIESMGAGEKLELEEDVKLQPLKQEMNAASRNKDKQEKKIQEKKKKLDFFGDL